MVITGQTRETLDQAVESLGGREHALGVAGNAADPTHRGAVVGRGGGDVRVGGICW